MNRCDCCGKYRKLDDIKVVIGEYDEQWIECRYCMSEVDVNRYFKENFDYVRHILGFKEINK